ncbi:MAG: COG1361 S-layer family protein [Methanotrichaceae archaeon]
MHSDICGFVCLLVLFTALAETSSASGEVYFVGDHYKVQGEPILEVTSVNSRFHPGEKVTLKLVLANSGNVEQLVPNKVSPGDGSEAAQEMLAEFGCEDASNLKIKLHSDGPIKVTSGPVDLKYLDSGQVVPLEFELAIGDNADGVYHLPLDLDYEHQVDVRIHRGERSPLYVPVRQNQKIKVNVEGDAARFKIVGSKSNLSPGKNGTLVLVIKNVGRRLATNCAARPIFSPPFEQVNSQVFLGDLGPGDMAVARFSLIVDENAQAQDYQQDCEISHDDGTCSCTLSVVVKGSNKIEFLAAFLALVFLAGSALVFLRRRRSQRIKSLRTRRILWRPRSPFR